MIAGAGPRFSTLDTAPREVSGLAAGSPRLTVWTAPELRGVGRLRAVSRAFLNGRGLTGLTDTVELLVSEMAANAVEHSHGDRVTLSLTCEDGQVRLDVTGGGAQDRPRLRHPGPDEESGRGLLIVDSLAEEWGTSDDGQTTWCTVAV